MQLMEVVSECPKISEKSAAKMSKDFSVFQHKTSRGVQSCSLNRYINGTHIAL